jgi:hypothetical protein
MKLRIAASFMALVIVAPAFAYDYPLTPESIRAAYVLGSGPERGGAKFLAAYSQALTALKVGAYTSVVRIETPFAQVTEHASVTMNYSAQDAVKEFRDKPAVFRIYLDICYLEARDTPIRIRVVQDDKEIAPESDERTPYIPFQDASFSVPSIGEHVQLGFKPGKIESSMLFISIDTPNNLHGEAKFDLAILR